MLFNSLNFLIFFPLVTTAYFLLPQRFRWFLLLMASCYFYMAFIPAFILILAFTITVDYIAGLAIEQAAEKRRKQILIASILSNIGVLFFFKYFNFFNANLSALADFLHWNYSLESLAIILPIGLSFHTFQSLSYTIEVYRDKQKAERHFGIFALYVMFYPQLVAGPIERPQNLLHQFREKHEFEYQNVVRGLKLIAWGMFKKVVIADRLAVLVNTVYGDVHTHSGLPLFIATVFFAFQIYCDFSGYSDIAIGSARVMGFRLMNNFRQPYFSRSIGEFWHRWHISLSTWFKDYVYVPLGGSKVTKYLHVRNLLITFLLSGLWHGANWTYVVWGGLNGIYLVAEMQARNLWGVFPRPSWGIWLTRVVMLWQTLFTFTLVCLTWVFFRANTISDAFFVIQNMFSWIPHTAMAMLSGSPEYFLSLRHSLWLGLSPWDFTVAIIALLILFTVELAEERGGASAHLATKPSWVRTACYYVLVCIVIFFGYYNTGGPQLFIYFQF